MAFFFNKVKKVEDGIPESFTRIISQVHWTSTLGNASITPKRKKTILYKKILISCKTNLGYTAGHRDLSDWRPDFLSESVEWSNGRKHVEDKSSERKKKKNSSFANSWQRSSSGRFTGIVISIVNTHM